MNDFDRAVSKWLHEWESQREFLNVSPDSKRRFIERMAAALAKKKKKKNALRSAHSLVS